MKDISKNLNILCFDSISKFNIYDKKNLVYFKKLKVFVNIKTSESNFLNNFLSLSKILFFLFNRKLQVLKVLKEFTKSNKLRNSLIFCVGLTFRNKEVFYSLNYLLNIIFIASKSMDDSLSFKRKESGFLYFFSNSNYLLGLNSLKYFN